MKFIMFISLLASAMNGYSNCLSADASQVRAQSMNPIKKITRNRTKMLIEEAVIMSTFTTDSIDIKPDFKKYKIISKIIKKAQKEINENFRADVIASYILNEQVQPLEDNIFCKLNKEGKFEFIPYNRKNQKDWLRKLNEFWQEFWGE